MLELLELLGVLAVALAFYSLLLGRRVIDDRDRQGPTGENARQGEVDRENLGACCGFGLPPVAEFDRINQSSSAEVPDEMERGE